MKNYKNTLNLPKTNFPMKGNLINKEFDIISYWNFKKLYKKIRESKKKKKKFILHDGPLYANGKIHIGHAVNKIIKDIIIKSKNMSGFNAPYVPGWDCHGLPIELKIEKNNKIKKKISNLEFRKKCRIYANKQVLIQKKELINLGILADWDNPYLTMDYKIEANIIRAFKKILNYGYLINGKKPIHWCINCQSSLSEAEIEYYNIESLGIYILFNSIENNKILNKFKINYFIKNINLIIWTTTPWTLLSNKAIAINPNLIYQFIKIKNKYLILSKDTVINIMKLLNIKTWKILSQCKGLELELCYFKHPILNFNVPILLSNHIIVNTGSGAVHIAPSHGLEDFIVSKKYALNTSTQINKYGNYISNTHTLLNKKFIFNVNNIIIKLLKQNKNFLYKHKIIHKYPHCWRHKTKIFLRITYQWFINLNKNNLRKKLIQNIKKIKWIPKTGKKYMENMIKKRPDWCISRQRLWGVPITLFINKKTLKIHPYSNKIIKKTAKLVEKMGIQVWWDLDKKKILGINNNDYFKINDTLDVWFDSGTTHYSVITKKKKYKSNISDLYVEGSDQYRGWFMSSLITSNIINKNIPFKEILVHGFTVDKKKKKMSKSIGNIISPIYLIKKFSCDVLRLWIAYTEYTNEIIVSEKTIKNSIEIYRKIRNTIRFLLSNLNDFNPNIKFLNFKKMIILDLWALKHTFKIQKKIINAYNKYNFKKVIKYLIKFCSIEMGSFYFDIIKDRQYTTKKNSINRKSCQITMFHILESLVRWIAPILSFTANEVWNYLPGKREEFIFTEEWYNNLYINYKSKILNNILWKELIKLKYKINKKIEILRFKKKIGSSLQINIIICANKKLIKYLKKFNNELKFFFIISNIKLITLNELNNKINYFKLYVNISKKKKCNRCWHYSNNICNISKYIGICNRCIFNIFGKGEKRKFI
ncbi:MAG: isoleucine--tRNA ligase [Enterobacteriaceae bacterium PSpicST2]|nr:MAG: isoleucine--tRNA ligase [Enterobacteriaceae bacterium PSpicST2]